MFCCVQILEERKRKKNAREDCRGYSHFVVIDKGRDDEKMHANYHNGKRLLLKKL